MITTTQHRARTNLATNPEEEFNREPSAVVANQCNIAVDSAQNQLGVSEELQRKAQEASLLP